MLGVGAQGCAAGTGLAVFDRILDEVGRAWLINSGCREAARIRS